MILKQQSLRISVQSETSNKTRESVPGTHDYQLIGLWWSSINRLVQNSGITFLKKGIG